MEQGHCPNPRQPALKAYAAALKRGSSPAEILAGVKARVGVDKEGTSCAPQLLTWLNQDRWKDGATTGMTAEEMAAAEQRIIKAKRKHDEDMRRLVESKCGTAGCGMKPEVFYCHPCLTEMGMERNGSRRRRDGIASMDDKCPCCKQTSTLFNIRDYQRVRRIDYKRPRERKPRIETKKVFFAREWPSTMRFD